LSRPLEIRAAAIRLFYERGYNATSLKEIADVVQLRAPSLYNHIDSKQKLLQEIMFDGIAALTKDFDDAVAQSHDLIEQIRLGAEALVRHNVRRQQQAYVNTYEIPSLEEPARTELIRQRRAYIDRWVALIKRGVAEGVVVAPEPMLAAFNIIDLIAGLARWYRPSGRWTEDDLVAHYGRLTLCILQCRQ
jgi:AcrR family transcriptional regulator